ncbi:MAG TPA: pyridoxal 5'-phosphate synthase glutaminase subunit PdxT [Terriglobales bacterium]|nr:pyridoxal 5'-phosphate synthase glutaminase subunit PdxT [Terriglobales bacterium]
MLVGILALQGDFAAHAAAVGELSCPTRLVRTVADFDGLDAIILPGGESSAMLKLLAQDGLWQRLQEFVRQQPTFGTCAGSILMATRVTSPEQASLGVLDATVIRNGYGRQIDSSIRHAQVTPAFIESLKTSQLETVLIRAPQFRDLGPKVEVVATMDKEPVLLRQGRCLAASFHPELSSDRTIHRWFLDNFLGL